MLNKKILSLTFFCVHLLAKEKAQINRHSLISSMSTNACSKTQGNGEEKNLLSFSLFFLSLFQRKFENLYVGWGHKFDADNYTPPPPPAAMEEYPVVPEVTEVDDPTVEEERALKKAQEEAMEAAEDMDDVDDDEDDDD